MDDFVNISDLKERAKELNCLYLIDEALTMEQVKLLAGISGK